MKTHCRCRSCGARKKLDRHTSEYRNRVECPRCGCQNDYMQDECGDCGFRMALQPMCQCGARNWRKDEYRHRVEIPQMRSKQGRYRICHCDGLIQFTNAHPHRIGCRQCCYKADGTAKEMQQMEGDLAYLQGADSENNGYLEV